jgi:hypothetical protein
VVGRQSAGVEAIDEQGAFRALAIIGPARTMCGAVRGEAE